MDERIEKLEKRINILEKILYTVPEERPTQKQLSVIRYIEKNLNLEYTGHTKDDARDFISKNIVASKNVKVKGVNIDE